MLAARKAFVMNVIGDVGMVIAALVIFETFGTLNFADVFASAPGMFRPNDDSMLLITLLLLVGAFAKSAQLPLHTWLPDALQATHFSKVLFAVQRMDHASRRHKQ